MKLSPAVQFLERQYDEWDWDVPFGRSHRDGIRYTCVREKKKPGQTMGFKVYGGRDFTAPMFVFKMDHTETPETEADYDAGLAVWLYCSFCASGTTHTCNLCGSEAPSHDGQRCCLKCYDNNLSSMVVRAMELEGAYQ